MPANKPWQDILKNPVEPTNTGPVEQETKMVDVRLIQQTSETTKRTRRKKAPKAAPVPQAAPTPQAATVPILIPILRKTHITTPPLPTTEVRENSQAGSSNESSSAQQLQRLVEDTESEASDWTEFMEPPSEAEAPPNSTPREATDPTNDVIVKDDETQKTYVKL